MSAPKAFRSRFGDGWMKKVLEWFPGHMGKGLKQMQQKLANVDCTIEVHDARIPLSGRTELFRNTVIGVRPHIFVLNKCDLIPESMKPVIVETLTKNRLATDILFTDCRTPQGEGVTDILPCIINKMQDICRYNRQHEKSFNILVMGVPNVGKSSLINVMRNYYTKKRKGTRVGAVAGITRSVLNRIQVCYEPPLYLYDTPGILEPHIKHVEAGFRLALCASMQDHLVGMTNIADYLLYWLNKNEHFSYVKELGLKEPCDDITEVLTVSALSQNLYIKMKDPSSGQIVRRPDLEISAYRFVTLFRKGKLGQFVLDSDVINGSLTL